MKHAKLLLFALIALGVLDIGLVLAYWPIEDPELFARGSLAIHLIFAVMIGILFWFFQKIDNEKMQEILDKIDERETNTIAHWGGRAIGNLKTIREFHATIQNLIVEYLKDKSDKNKESVVRVSDTLGSLIKDWHIVQIRNDISQLQGIVKDPALVSDVAGQTTSYAGAFQVMRSDWVWQDNQSLEGQVKAIDNQIVVINALIARIEKEMPNIEPRKMKTKKSEE